MYDPEVYWAKRYAEIDVTRSGHIDLPATYNLWLYRRKKELLLQSLRGQGFKAEGATVLEIATGSGVYVDLWKRQGVRRLTGIDISEAATAAMRARFPGFEFHKRDLSAPGLVDLVGTGFDLVTAIDMLYYIVDDGAFAVALGNLASATAPGGLLAINDIFLRGAMRDFGYIKLRPLQAYVDALAAAGFDVVSRRPTFFSAVQWVNVRAPSVESLHDRLWKRLGAPAIDRFPGFMGGLTYGIDRTLGAVLRDGPSFEMMVCRRRR